MDLYNSRSGGGYAPSYLEILTMQAAQAQEEQRRRDAEAASAQQRFQQQQDQIAAMNAAIPGFLQINSSTGQPEYSQAYNQFMSNEANPAVAKAQVQETAGGPGAFNSFASARTAQLQAALAAKADEVGQNAKNSALSRLQALRSSYLGVPTTGGTSYGSSGSYGSGGSSSSDSSSGGGALSSVMRMLYGADSATGGALSGAAAGLGGLAARGAVSGLQKLFSGSSSNPFANTVNQQNSNSRPW